MGGLVLGAMLLVGVALIVVGATVRRSEAGEPQPCSCLSDDERRALPRDARFCPACGRALESLED